ncbi:MAG: DUF1343 domain-containing protein, partial [Pseudomonadota bacterium]
MEKTGLQVLLQDPAPAAKAGRLGLLYNQASVGPDFGYAADLISAAFPGRLKVLFGPQHGIWCTEQDNMRETDHAVHPRLGLPVFSLYSSTRRPFPAMLEETDSVLVDIQDVGTRVYTFAATVLYLMEECAKLGKEVWILDRPNPINGIDVEGNVLKPEFASFVGPHPIPMRHGMTMGELMTFYNEVHAVGCRLRVVPMTGWHREFMFNSTGLPWIMPSPNMPTPDTALVYPGQVILEGTNISEGRGTTRPFEVFGAPFIDPLEIIRRIEPGVCDGAILRPLEFRPTFNKWSGQVCKG